MAKRKSQAPKKTKSDAAMVNDLVIEALNKQFGAGTINTLDHVPMVEDCPWQISTGSIGLDIAIGPLRRMPDGSWMTGMPPSRMGEIFGDESTGKTTVMIQMIVSAQRVFKKLGLGLRTAFIDMEHSLDPTYCQKLGVDMSEMVVSQPDSGDQAMSIIDALLKTQQFGLIIVDSVASLIPVEELEGDVNDDHVGGQARMMSQGLRKFSTFMGATSDCKTVLMFTNQTRYKIGAKQWSNPVTTPGGKALKFFANLRMEVKAGSTINDDDNKPWQDRVQMGHRMYVTCIKNKNHPPYRRADTPFYYGVGVDRGVELIELCKRHGILHSAGAWLSHPCGIKAQGEMQAIAQLKSDPRKYGRPLYDALLTKVMADRGQKPDGSPLEGYVPPPPVNAVADDMLGAHMEAEPEAGAAEEEVPE